ncbi:molybdate ABC transporter permease subunit [Gilvimarinus polysaccharolyticus]|uniref:molybdate ABC transporter permease subunit n=1 Tax=Gilvimarinus polysaccharolyticus TaxID=863921 RepID=UPI000ADBABDD|nr:molybdate ABC transporter permease subunit [Gilvimarinus polysaccharolyticus]
MNAAIWITCKLALVTTLVLLVLGTPLAWWLAQGRARHLRTLVEAAVALPLILPPTVLGFYLLLLLAPDGAIGQFSQSGLAFSFTGLVIGSVIYSLPFVVQPLAASFSQLEPRVLQLGRSQGLNPFQLLRHIVLPATRHAFVMASALGFAHTVGEFGVVLMIGGNISGETQVLSILLFDEVETLNFAQAHRIAGGLLAASFALLVLLYSWQKKRGHTRVAI